MLTDGAPKHTYRVSLLTLPESRITRADLADFMVHELSRNTICAEGAVRQ